MKKVFTGGTLISPFETISDGAVVVGENGLIEYAGPMSDAGSIQGDRINTKGQYIIPGLINTHVHGGNGFDFCSENLEEGLEGYSKWVVGNGVTGFILTLTGPDADAICDTIRFYADLLDNRTEWPGAIPLGLHLEGPFLNPEKHGAYNTDWIREPSLEETERYIESGRGWIKHISMAPELKNADIVADYLVKSDVVVSLGHSNTDYQTASAALRGNFTHTTHAFNCQSVLHHRAPGVVGAILSSDTPTAELTGDPAHVYPPAMNILYRCLGSERIVLITDAIAGTGLPDGKYSLMEQEVIIKDSVARYADGSLGGSVSTMNSCLRVLVNQVGAPLDEAVRMAAFNPAKVIGEDQKSGSLEIGKQANLVIMDQDLEVQQTFVRGQLVYSKDS